MAGLMGRLADEAKSMLGETGLAVYANGYGQAADISLGIMEEKIAEFHKRATSGDFPSEHEQFLSGKLYELKAEMEKALRDFWEHGGPAGVRADERR